MTVVRFRVMIAAPRPSWFCGHTRLDSQGCWEIQLWCLRLSPHETILHGSLLTLTTDISSVAFMLFLVASKEAP